MKKFTTIVFSLLLLASITFMWGCKKVVGCTDSAAANFNSNANEDNGGCEYATSFYSTDNSPNYTITVTGSAGTSQQATTSGYFTSGSPACGQSGCANFSLIPDNYNYSAVSSLGTVTGSFTVVAGTACNLVPLSTGTVTFWTANNSDIGDVITIPGYTPQTITASYNGNPGCNAQYSASFQLPAGVSFNYTVTGPSTASGTFSLTAEQCLTLQLN